MMQAGADQQREFAESVVRRLREAGFTAYFAGGCVRDRLLGRVPVDYDVATSAKPPEIRNLFGRRRTLAIGAAFGVISVLGPTGAGQVEVATFRRDAPYSDGRHPDAVVFSSAEEDARRRDFTINGLFYDPVSKQVIDFVGGQFDIQRRVVRAIGNPRERLAEDKLRLLRAIRFAATFDFELDVETAHAVREMAPQIVAVSPERIAMEMRRLLTAERAEAGVRLLLATGLAGAVLPEIVPRNPAEQGTTEQNLAALGLLVQPSFPLALAALLHGRVDPPEIGVLGRRWRLSRRETERTTWLSAHRTLVYRAREARFSEIQPALVAEGANELLALAEAFAPGSTGVAHCRALLCRPPSELNPPPLVDGAALLARGIPPGPIFSRLLVRARTAQLDGEVVTCDQAVALIDQEMARTEVSTPTEQSSMDKKVKKKIQTLHERIQKLRQQLAGARKQADEPGELNALEQQIAAAEAELAKLKS